ncbi:MAG: matrixin family metalloprotease [Vicinamibacteraceae bacterium]
MSMQSNRLARAARWAAGPAAFLIVCLSASVSHAYSYSTCDGNPIRWNGSWANMYISTTSFPAGGSGDAGIQNAMWHWNNVKGSGFNFYVGRDTDGTHDDDNGQNEVYYDTSLSGSTLAVTRTRYHCYWAFGWNYGIDETDIGFNNNIAWTTSAFDYGSLGSPFSLESVALHELGHALGLLHEDRWMATMNSYYPNSGPLGYDKEWDPLADDRLAGRVIYPDNTTEVDVAGSAFMRTGSGTSGLVSSTLSAARGSNVTIDVTFSNQSTSTQTFDINFYLSTNSLPSAADIYLGSNYGASGSQGAQLTFSRTLTIPSSVAPGTYYLGYVIDPSNALSEDHESNNPQPMPRTITIY